LLVVGWNMEEEKKNKRDRRLQSWIEKWVCALDGVYGLLLATERRHDSQARGFIRQNGSWSRSGAVSDDGQRLFKKFLPFGSP